MCDTCALNFDSNNTNDCLTISPRTRVLSANRMLDTRYQDIADATAFLRRLCHLTPDFLDGPTKSRLREEAEQLKKLIDELKTKLQALEDRLDEVQYDLSSLVYPVNTLPAETLCQIFAAALSTGISPRSRRRVTMINRPRLRITAVCRYWRSIAIADPHLWTQTYYLINSNNPQRDLLFENFLPRTHSLPIKFTLIARAGSQSLPHFVFDSVAQWKEVCLINVYWPRNWAPNTATNQGIDCPQLTKLTFDATKDRASTPQDLLMNAPCLRELSTCTITDLFSRLSFPPQRLKKLTLLQPVNYKELILLLAQLVGLEELSITMSSPHGWEDRDLRWGLRPLAPVRLPCLSTLLVAEGHILKFLDLPVLTTLHLLQCYTEDVNLLGACILRSSANITSLFLAPINSIAYITALSSLLSSLKHLALTLLDMNPDEALQCSANFARLDYLPNLESISFIDNRPEVAFLCGSIRPFLEGIAMRAANALLSGAPHRMKLTRLVLDSRAPGVIPAEDMRDLAYLQRRLRSLRAKQDKKTETRHI
ncbi:F-box domain-containing protein [Mycena indigotica]|uniref:F-box domain-containing protein n=1 Tax=Mycena indigotica TaxID=2126181 RepID=A0A8H6S6D4_9AGAR|nr:F-box domain-containing protein [Mycena indigotica]KAF7293719.1 F-box domain-containing protein [Mycena indigotica]